MAGADTSARRATPGLSGDLYLTASRGTEGVLREELVRLGHPEASIEGSGVRVRGDLRDALELSLSSRIAVRVLVHVRTFDARDADELYRAVADIDWPSFLQVDQTLSVAASSTDSELSHTQFISQKTKDAVVDRLRTPGGLRPSVDRDDPDLAIFVHIRRNKVRLYLEAQGAPLFQRGYRLEHGEAPIKETLAAALLALAGYAGESLIDPLCGSGTFVTEAALFGRAPNGHRARFGVERWACIDDEWRASFAATRASLSLVDFAEGVELLGSDRDTEVLSYARRNAQRAETAGRRAEETAPWPVHFEERALGELEPRSGGLVIANLPYGVRLTQDRDFYVQLRRMIDRAAPSMRIGLLLGTPPPRGIFPKPVAVHPIWNGTLECRFAVFGAA